MSLDSNGQPILLISNKDLKKSIRKSKINTNDTGNKKTKTDNNRVTKEEMETFDLGDEEDKVIKPIRESAEYERWKLKDGNTT